MNDDAIWGVSILLVIAVLFGGIFWVIANDKQKRNECVALIANKPAIEIQAICK